MSELAISDHFNDVRPEQSSVPDSKSTRTPLSDTRCDTESLNTEGIVGLHPRYEKTCVPDARGVARKRSQPHSQSEGGYNNTPVNIGNDIVGKTTK